MEKSKPCKIRYPRVDLPRVNLLLLRKTGDISQNSKIEVAKDRMSIIEGVVAGDDVTVVAHAVQSRLYHCGP